MSNNLRLVGRKIVLIEKNPRMGTSGDLNCIVAYSFLFIHPFMHFASYSWISSKIFWVPASLCKMKIIITASKCLSDAVGNVGVGCELFRSHSHGPSSVCCCFLWIGTTLNCKIFPKLIESKSLCQITVTYNGVLCIFYRKKTLNPYLCSLVELSSNVFEKIKQHVYIAITTNHYLKGIAISKHIFKCVLGRATTYLCVSCALRNLT